MSKETAFYPRLKALTDEWMDLFGYWAPLTVTDTLEEYQAVSTVRRKRKATAESTTPSTVSPERVLLRRKALRSAKPARVT